MRKAVSTMPDMAWGKFGWSHDPTRKMTTNPATVRRMPADWREGREWDRGKRERRERGYKGGREGRRGVRRRGREGGRRGREEREGGEGGRRGSPLGEGSEERE